MRLVAVVGTRPEAIKMAPVILALRAEPSIETLVCSTGQHREMLDQVLELFGIEPDVELGLMDPDQGLNGFLGQAIARLDEALASFAPNRVLVHGDTTTALAAALASFHRRIPVGHVEAGLRTYALDRPWPEEMNRRAIDVVSDLLFAPTRSARRNLKAEALAGSIVVTGNSGIDALETIVGRLASDDQLRARADAALPALGRGRRLMLVTGHRRESFGEALRGICEALSRLARSADVDIVYPVHLNPEVRRPVEAALGGTANIHLLPPLDFLPFVRLMQRADLILTDSGGIQEEAPSLGKPVLVMRDVTERPEAVEAGTAKLVGTDPARIVDEVERLLGRTPKSFAVGANPYGDGQASARIVDALLGRPFDEFGGTPAGPGFG
ncbi:non-hydrolyzing UDP-N-acetylglucosamine 2-epimerase [Allosphingosinicella sp.]|jgi:UDP-N-acetylglucosamine 2-epimerase (non-hydrolysing)|uniref:non-hydrolyzing UDP-N-acetylglucosamine 2-epimerase n=1 Tax=Allosphingosinicella sp. TaxID=2823234 RepID=UPI002F1F36C1